MVTLSAAARSVPISGGTWQERGSTDAAAGETTTAAIKARDARARDAEAWDAKAWEKAHRFVINHSGAREV
jgi:hypothetical protein